MAKKKTEKESKQIIRSSTIDQNIISAIILLVVKL